MVGLSIDWQLVRLPNGLRLITIARPFTPTVAVRLFARAGSRYDAEQSLADAQHLPLGLAHITEHLILKGTRSRSQSEFFAAVERLGGVLEAGTTKEYVALCAITPRNGLATAVRVLAEIVTAPALRDEDFWSEKLVLLEEIQRSHDRESVIFDLFAEAIWRENPLRHPTQGTLQGLYDLDHQAVLSFFGQRYVAGNMLLVVCGDIEHLETRQLVSASFSSILAGPDQPPELSMESPFSETRRTHLLKDVNLTHLLIGVPTVGMKHEDRSALKVIERVLGMGGSARLYQRLRAEAHLVYSVNTIAAHYEDAGYFAVRTACDPAHVSQVQQSILQEWDRLREKGVSDNEMVAAKSNYAGTLARRFETNRSVAGVFGTEALLHRAESLEEAVERIDAVQHSDVLRVARKYLNSQCHIAVTVGRQPDL